MGQILGNLTNPTGVQLPSGQQQFYPSQGAATMSMAHQAANTAAPSTSDVNQDIEGNGTISTPNPKPEAQPQMVKPSFIQAATTGPGGTPNAMSPELTKAGKLVTLLTSGLKGALAGRAAQEQMIAQTGGRRAGGVGTGFQAGYAQPFQQVAMQQQAQQGQAATQVAQAGTQPVQTPYGQMPAALASKILAPYLGYQGKIGSAQIGAGATEQAAQTKGAAQVQAAQVSHRFVPVPNVGLFDTQNNQMVPGTAQGVQVTPEIAQDYGLPQEAVGKPMPLSTLASFQKNAISTAPTVKNSTDPLGLTTTSTTTKQLPGRGTPPARPAGSGASNGNPANPNKPNILQGAGQRLVDGDMAPSQVPRRGAAYLRIQQEADAYSQQKYGRPFDIAKADSDYAYAKSAQTQNIFKLIDGITEKGGSLQIAHDAAAKLPQMDSQTLNKVFNAGATEFGSQEVSNFHTAMLGLADEYSKVMGGGVSSDTGRQQGLDLLKAQYSKGQFGGAEDIIKKDLSARKQGLIGTNTYLQRQYGEKSQGSQGGNGARRRVIDFTQ